MTVLSNLFWFTVSEGSDHGCLTYALGHSTVVERWYAKENCLVRLVITVSHRDHSLLKLLMPFFPQSRAKKHQDTIKYPILAVCLLQLGSPKVSRTSKLVLLRVGGRKANGCHLSLQGKFHNQTIIGCASNQEHN